MGREMMEALLMTGTIKPFSNIKHCDVNIRYAEYMENIRRYIMQSNFDAVIFAENSGYEIDIGYLKSWLRRIIRNLNISMFQWIVEFPVQICLLETPVL